MNRLSQFFLIFLLVWPMQLVAQSQFSPAVTVNDRVVTRYEVNQRILMLDLFRTPGDLAEVAREQLIEDRLKEQELARAGLRISEEGMEAAMTEFAGRFNLDVETFLAQIASEGVAPETIRDYVRIQVTWRDYIRGRYRGRVEITEDEIDRALGQAGGSGAQIEVLLSEIIIAAPPDRAAQAMDVANQISQLRSTEQFSDAARQVSALPSRDNGGRLGWLPITNYPAPLRGVILALDNGEVTSPIPIENGVALFQMRGVREAAGRAPVYGAIEFASLYLPGGRSDATLSRAQKIIDDTDTCNDLYGVAQRMPEGSLVIEALAPADIPETVALELARLDPGESSTNLTSSDGESLRLIMMCGRTPVLEGDVDREAIRNQLAGRRLQGYADALVADLKASATIQRQ